MLDEAGEPLGIMSPLATDEFSCIEMCEMTDGCVSVDWKYKEEECYLHQADTGCNSVTESLHVAHYELTDCSM